MVLGIDASNIKTGGGLTHLVEMLKEAEPEKFGFSKVIVWGGNQLKKLEPRPWLHLDIQASLVKGSLINETLWKLKTLPILAEKECDLLFCPGGTFASKKIKYVSMSQNMLIFDKKERNRFSRKGFSWWRLNLLHHIQRRSFLNAHGIIFLSYHARQTITRQLELAPDKFPIIHHGISEAFKSDVSPQKEIKDYAKENPLSLLYVSTVDVYKHQWTVVSAVSKLIDEGMHLRLDLIGSADPRALKKLERARMNTMGNAGKINYKGLIEFSEIPQYYKKADLFIFASSCENMPNIVLEAMHSGIPIACSDFPPMPEFLKDTAVYFDPTSAQSIYDIIKYFLELPELRYKKAQAAKAEVKQYSWKRCADETFSYLQKIANH